MYLQSKSVQLPYKSLKAAQQKQGRVLFVNCATCKSLAAEVMFGMTFALVWTSGHEFLHVRSWICGGFINLLVNSAQHVANLTILDILGWPTALARHPTRHPDYFHSHMCATGRMPKGVSQGLWGPPCCFSARMKNIPLWMGFDEDQLWFRRCAMTTAGS